MKFTIGYPIRVKKSKKWDNELILLKIQDCNKSTKNKNEQGLTFLECHNRPLEDTQGQVF